MHVSSESDIEMMLSVLVALFPIAASYKVVKAEAPNLLLDLYNSDVIERCDFQNLSSIAPFEVDPGRSQFFFRIRCPIQISCCQLEGK